MPAFGNHCEEIEGFGGVLICNAGIDKATADAINEIFFEVLIAPNFDADALEVLRSKKNRIVLRHKVPTSAKASEGRQGSRHRIEMQRSLLNGVLIQGTDEGNYSEWKEVGGRETTVTEKEDLIFANFVCKHLKSNARLQKLCFQSGHKHAASAWAAHLGEHFEHAAHPQLPLQTRDALAH